ncbi:hypothetical protein ACFQZQ_10810 [Lysobacter koreensis]|uniref:Uncharacterized protein n=1 Tax=Lysobacter koreensis TaxID=266122 RepID=A0ABW2YNZ2_9GAMM
MSQPEKAIKAKTRWLALIIALLVIAYGAYIIVQAHAPERFTRFGYAGPLFGNDARAYGLVVVLLGCLPLLLLCRTPRQAALFGALLGILLLIAIFALAYA